MIGDMIRASLLDPTLYERVEHDDAGEGRARTVILIVALFSGIGAALFSRDHGAGAMAGAFALRFSGIWIGWIAWAAVSVWIGTTLTAGDKTRSDFRELRRTLAYAFSPWVLAVFVFLPGVGPILFAAASFWVLIAGVVAIRQALDFTTTRAVWTVVSGWVVMMAVLIVFAVLAAVAGIVLGSIGR